ncbi:MAG: response regulator transcription factor, partial [Bacteroidetes bacterium]|nr:response regulator transcription factor [Bacteroidota bacterium]
DTLEETLVGLQTGANDYIKKPFHFSELLERIKVQLRNKPETTQVLDLADIQVSLASRQVSRSGKEIMLTQKEFDLLVYLLQNKGKVCTRTKIIQEVWDIHFEYNTGVIDVYINALRKKLKLNDFDKHIQTIRGVGYLAKE